MKLENIFLTLVEMIEEYNILLFTIFGWIVIFIINKHFFKIKNIDINVYYPHILVVYNHQI